MLYQYLGQINPIGNLTLVVVNAARQYILRPFEYSNIGLKHIVHWYYFTTMDCVVAA